MPSTDITFCTNIQCPINHECFRYHRQTGTDSKSYARFDCKISCDYFIKKK